MISCLKFLWNHIESILGAILMAVMASLSFMNVVTRYVFNYSTAWTEELVIYLAVWATLAGTALAYRQGSNLMVVVIYNKTRGIVKKALYLFSTVASISFFTILGYYGYHQVRFEFLYNTLMESVPIKMGYFSASIPICSVLIICRIIEKAMIDWKQINKADDCGGDIDVL